jgi:TonB family protein
VVGKNLSRQHFHERPNLFPLRFNRVDEHLTGACTYFVANPLVPGYDSLARLRHRVRQNWYSLMPQIARKGEKGRVVVTFTIVRNGTVQDPRVRLSSGNDVLDRAAFGAVTSSSPFAALPADFKGEQIVLQLSFSYNLKSEER